jgi:hypothetical protein
MQNIASTLGREYYMGYVRARLSFIEFFGPCFTYSFTRDIRELFNRNENYVFFLVEVLYSRNMTSQYRHTKTLNH